MTEPAEKASPPLRTWRPMAAWTAGIALCLVLASCGGSGTAIDSDKWPRGSAEKPGARDLVGTWNLSSESVALARTKGGYTEFATAITLSEDGTARIRQMPDCSSGSWPGTNSKKALNDYEGTWRLTESQTYWAVAVSDKAGNQVLELRLWNRKAPYRMWFAVGDPDSGDYLFLDRQPRQ